jgi:hypothetical protein
VERDTALVSSVEVSSSRLRWASARRSTLRLSQKADLLLPRPVRNERGGPGRVEETMGRARCLNAPLTSGSLGQRALPRVRVGIENALLSAALHSMAEGEKN